jgi:AcrR family transcriptional regulator
VPRRVSASEEVLRPDQALRLEDIAALIGSARATLYCHFSDRDDLVAFLLEEHLRAAAETIELAVTTAQPPPVGQLRSAITALVGFLGGSPGYAPACSPSREPPDD